MTARDLIIGLLENCDNLDKEIKLYSLINMDHINKDLPEFEFISDDIVQLDNSNEKILYICGDY